MKICIIGAGVSGLAIGRLLNKKHDVHVLEKSDFIGGTAHTRDVDGIAFHKTGGHCFNSKNKNVLDFVFNEILPVENWNLIERKAKIITRDMTLSYPIEYSVREIFGYDPELALSITKDFLNASRKNSSLASLADFFKNNFGETLANLYFIPYNQKIWNLRPENMSPDWVHDKLPLPDYDEFLKSLISLGTDKMPHRTFYYPKSNNQNTFLDALSEGLNIRTSNPVKTITKNSSGWLINGEKFDILINTSPLDTFLDLLNDKPLEVELARTKLKYNKVKNILWRSKPTDATWTYYPDSTTPFHRHIHIGNFHRPKTNYTITEAVGDHDICYLIAEGKKLEHLIEPVSSFESEHAYVVFDSEYAQARETCLKYLTNINVESVGRFAEWEYYNMDVCIEKALSSADKINQ